MYVEKHTLMMHYHFYFTSERMMKLHLFADHFCVEPHLLPSASKTEKQNSKLQTIKCTQDIPSLCYHPFIYLANILTFSLTFCVDVPLVCCRLSSSSESEGIGLALAANRPDNRGHHRRTFINRFSGLFRPTYSVFVIEVRGNSKIVTEIDDPTFFLGSFALRYGNNLQLAL